MQERGGMASACRLTRHYDKNNPSESYNSQNYYLFLKFLFLPRPQDSKFLSILFLANFNSKSKFQSVRYRTEPMKQAPILAPRICLACLVQICIRILSYNLYNVKLQVIFKGRVREAVGRNRVITGSVQVVSTSTVI